jgi:transcriptional regulator with XRE-family HTH domain
MSVLFGRDCREARIRLDLAQRAVADAVGISRGYLARVEAGRANPTLELVGRLASTLGLRVELIVRPPTFVSERRAHDFVDARCSAAVDRRLTSAGWLVAREVELVDGAFHGWIDLLAFDPRTGTLLIIEIKTRLDDIGATERQIAWYERHAAGAARRLGWRPQRVGAWLIALSSDEVDAAIGANREAFSRFPGRAAQMLGVVRGLEAPSNRGIALVDPTSHRADWLLRTRLDGRRSWLRYAGYAHAARILAPGKRTSAGRGDPSRRTPRLSGARRP